MTELHGFCHDDFEAVRTTFLGNFDAGNEVGASVCVTVEGETVVDLWAGDADEHGTPWAEDTIVNVWSTTKTMAATVMLRLIDQGVLDLEAPVATYWPEFATNGKEGVLVRHVMGHTAGLPGWDPAITMQDQYDWDPASKVLAEQAPWWEPGTASGYHLMTQGHLEGEIVRRATGRTLGTIFREDIAQPLGADFHIGAPESEHHRIGRMIVPEVQQLASLIEDGDNIGARAAKSCMPDPQDVNSARWRSAELPAYGGTGNARSVARVHAALANGGTLDGVEIMSPEGVDRIFTEQSHNTDLVLGVRMRMGTGFGLMNDVVPLSQSERACFWGGLGGSICLIDVDRRMSVAYVMNRMSDGLDMDMRGALCVVMANVSLDAAG